MTKNKKTVYLDTTIPSYYFDNRESMITWQAATQQWWQNEKQNYRLFISDVTLTELSEGSYPNKFSVIELIKNIEVLQTNEEIYNIAERYVKEKLMPKELEGDAAHLAYASFYKIDFLLTWNCNHLANANKFEHIRIINTKLNLFVPLLITPLQLMEEN